jgi:hypothetical protein
MDSVDIRDMIDQAQADVSAARVLRKGPNEGLDSLLDEVGDVPPVSDTTDTLPQEIQTMVDEDVEEEKTAAAAAVERQCHVKIAKLLASLDVISEVRS